MDYNHQFFQSVLDADLEYQELQKKHQWAGLEFRRLMEQLKQKDRETIYEYLGTLAELQIREIELALMLK